MVAADLEILAVQQATCLSCVFYKGNTPLLEEQRWLELDLCRRSTARDATAPVRSVLSPSFHRLRTAAIELSPALSSSRRAYRNNPNFVAAARTIVKRVDNSHSVRLW